MKTDSKANFAPRSTQVSSQPRHVRPGLVPTPVGYPWPNHVNWPNYYLGAHQQRHVSPIVYGYQPAYIHYASPMNNHMNSDVSSQHSYSDGYELQEGEKLSKTNLYIRGLHSSTTDEDLVAMCRMYGTIISTKAILHKDTNQCKGYGFVDFDNPNSAQRAVNSLQSKGIQAQMAKQQEQDPTNLYLSNLPRQLDEQQLQILLAPYGNVISTRILRDSNGGSKCVGFARMETKEICDTIISKLNGQYLPTSSQPLLVKFADGGPKKNKQDKIWRNPGEGYLGYEVRSPVSSSVTAGHNQRMNPVVQNQMMSQGPQQGGHMAAYSIPGGGVTWGVQQQQYAVPVSPHAVPVSPSQVESLGHIQSSIPHMTNQLAQLHMHGGGNQYIVPTVGSGGYGQQSWQMSQAHPQQGPGIIDGESSVIMTATEVESNFPPQHMNPPPHSSEHIYSDQHRVVYAQNYRK